MATATKKKKPAAATSGKPVKGQPRTKADGTPWTPTPRRPDADILAEYEEKLVKRKEVHAKEIAGIEAKIAWFKNRGAGVSAEEAVKELLAGGMTPDAILALEAKLRKAKEALKGKTPEEIEALKASAAPVPAFLVGATEEDEEDEE